MLVSGTKIGPYTIRESAGEGGMARVYKVWHDGLHRFEALKTPRGSHGNAPDSAYVTRLLAEARVAASLHHPNIVGIHNVSDPFAEVPFFTMDWVEGRDLAKVIAQRGSFSLEETIEILEPVASALDYAHEHGVVHRDVKPANILLGEVRGVIVPRVVDFGISRAAEDDEEGATKLTKSGMLVGTPEYMSPEQSGSGSPVDFRSDIYSLGVVAFEMLCGRPPFTALEGVSRLSILVSHVRDTAPLWDHVPHFPIYSGEVLLRALSKSPEKRYQNCRTFVAELKQAAEKDGPFTAFIYDANGQRTPFDASRFAPADAATMMEKPGASLSPPSTRPLQEGAATRVEPSGDTFMSLGARLNAPEAAQKVESAIAPATPETLTPKAKLLTRETPVPDAATPSAAKAKPDESSGVSTPASRLGLSAREAKPTRTVRVPSAAVLAVLGTCLVGGGLAWMVSGRINKAVAPSNQTETGKVKEKVDVEIAKAPGTQPVPTKSASLKPATYTKIETRPTAIPFPKKTVSSNKQLKGSKKVTQKGIAGEKVQKWLVTYQGKKALSSKPASPLIVVTRTPTPEITTLGTRAAASPSSARPVPRPRVRVRPVVQRVKPKPRVIKAKPLAPRRTSKRRSSYVPLPP